MVGVFTVPTQPAGTNTNDAASCAFVLANTTSLPTPVAGTVLSWNAAGTLVAKPTKRTASTTTITPTADDDGVTILCSNAAAQTVVANDIGVGNSYTLQWVGAATFTVTAGAGVTLVSPNASPSYKPVAQYGSLVVTVVATNTVCVQGNMLP